MLLHEQVEIQVCRQSLIEFIKSVNRNYTYIWYHELISNKVQELIDGTGKNLMLFVPPQHNKSTIVSRALPSWLFGKNPDLKIIHCAYGLELVSGFSRDIQRIMDTDFYKNCFPETRLGGRGGSYIRTNDVFEIVNKKGSYVCAGVGGGITGKSADIGIIDDPVRGASDANSITIRNKIWEWYLNDFKTRLHNDSKQIIIQTRWHQDDLAGRILENEADKWEVIILPAIKINNDNKDDIRQIGEPLYPELHSLQRLKEIEQLSPMTFASLYQQSPVINGGNIIKSEWFKYYKDLTFDKFDIWVDGAYTDKTKNDPTGILVTAHKDNYLYLIHAEKVFLEFPALIEKIKSVSKEFKNNIIRIEPKASGLSVVQHLKSITDLNVVYTKTPKDDKMTRLSVASPSVEGGKVLMNISHWNNEFINEVCGFPNAKHDEYVDLLSYAIDYYFKQNKFGF